MSDPNEKKTCAFKDCSEEATEWHTAVSDPERQGPWSVPVCVAHKLAMTNGDDYFVTESGELVTPLELVDWSVRHAGRGPMVELVFGNGGMIDRVVEARVDPEMLDAIKRGLG